MSASHIQIVIIKPANNIHPECFREVAETLAFAFQELDLPAQVVVNQYEPDGVNLILGWQLLTPGELAQLPPQCILFNLEQLSQRNELFRDRLVALDGRCELWDYSLRNIQILREAGLKQAVKHVPIGYVPQMTRIPAAAEQDIDVLFYGSLNSRRDAVLTELKDLGLNVIHVFGLYGAERDALIARAKVVLTLHFYDTNIFEIVRVSYLLANRKAVVAECGTDTEIDPDMRDAVLAVPYTGLARACLALVRDPQARTRLEEGGFNRMVNRLQADYLIRVMQDAPEPELPRSLNLGSGKDWRADCLNLDFQGTWHPDVVLDICAPLDPLRIHATERFGPIRLTRGTFDEILANDVLEHLPDLMTAMTNALDLLAEGGRFRIKVPYDLSYGAWQDPTHVRAFNERSWLYYTDWYWYMGWDAHRFDLESLQFVPSPVGAALLAKGMQGEELARQPRAIDDMVVVLRKRPLTEAERAEGRARRSGQEGAPRAPEANLPWQDLPVFIINRDRCGTLRTLVAWLTGLGMRTITIVDNDSTYPPLLEYYRSLDPAGPVQVKFLKTNGGPYALWKLGLPQQLGTPYIVTDSDLIPAPGCPNDLIARMQALLAQHPECGKVGAGLRLDNLSPDYGQSELVLRWEAQFWQRPAGNGVFAAAVDTTFALYPAGAPFSNGPHNLRLGYPYLFEHRPWYVDEGHLDAEEVYYRAHASSEFANWSVDNKASWLESTPQVKEYDRQPRVLHLGGGDEFIPGWVNADREAALGQDWRGGSLPFAAGTFDGIYMASPLAHPGDWPGLLAELLRVAKPGAKCFLRIPGGAVMDQGLLEAITRPALLRAGPEGPDHWEPLLLAIIGPEVARPEAFKPTLEAFAALWPQVREVAATFTAVKDGRPWQPAQATPAEIAIAPEALVFASF
jgi:SAM-dependent methyltransferase